MAYKKPQIVAKTAAKQSFVAGGGHQSGAMGCHASNASCMKYTLN